MSETCYGAFTDRETPGYHLVAAEDPERETHRELVRVPTLTLEGRRLVVGYEVVQEGLADADARRLILECLLDSFYQRDYERDADEILFIDERTGVRHLAAYGAHAGPGQGASP